MEQLIGTNILCGHLDLSNQMFTAMPLTTTSYTVIGKNHTFRTSFSTAVSTGMQDMPCLVFSELCLHYKGNM